MDRVEDEVVLFVRARVPGDDLSAAADHHLAHVAPDQDLPVPVGHRRRVVAGAGRGTESPSDKVVPQ